MAGEPDLPGMELLQLCLATGDETQTHLLQAMFDTLEADIVVMQETKIQRKDLRDDMVLVPGWDVYFSLPKYKKGGRARTAPLPKSAS